MKPPHMEVGLKAGVWPDLNLMQRTIKKAGYEPILDDVRLTVTGIVRQAPPGALLLELDGMKTVPAPGQKGGSAAPLPSLLPLQAAAESPATLEHLAEKHLGQKVTLEGIWVRPVAPAKDATLQVLSVLQAKA